MMEYFRRYLIFIRKQDNKTNLRPAFAGRLLIISIISIIIGVLLDIFMPFNFFLNMIRGIIANIAGWSFASYAYLMAVRVRRYKVKLDKYYQPLRKRFSYTQRINISIMIGVFISILILSSGNPSPIYTLKAAIFILIIILLITFSRKDRSEFLKNIYDIPDVRDLEFMSNRLKKINKKNKDDLNKSKRIEDKFKKAKNKEIDK
ncbi:MAG TPA: hypothetical protein GXZ90_08540 [Clostridiales bacterium]|nr:hypothetical protein [Clostridiales bacterium]